MPPKATGVPSTLEIREKLECGFPFFSGVGRRELGEFGGKHQTGKTQCNVKDYSV